MAVQKITETQEANRVRNTAKVLITQMETNNEGEIIESLRRAGLDELAAAMEEYLKPNGEVSKEDIEAAVYKYLQENGAEGILKEQEPTDDDVAKFYLFDGVLPSKKDEGAKPFAFRYISKTDDFSGYCTVKVQGDWSTTYPKKNFNIELFSDPERKKKLNRDFRGWGSTSKFTLKANYIDHTHARNLVNANLWAEIVRSRSDFDDLPEGIKTAPNNGAADGFPVKVYQNGNYYGIYTLNIRKSEFMFGMDKKNPLHMCVKGDNNDNGRVEDRAYNFRALWDGYDTHGDYNVEVGGLDDDTGKADDAIKDALNGLIACVKDTDDTTFRQTIGTYLDVQSAIDYMLMIWAFCGIDSAENNFMLLSYDGVKWYCNIYDADAAWGIYGNGNTQKINTVFPDEYMGNRSLLWERLLALYIPEIKARWAELRKSIINYPNITSKFERMWYWIGETLLAEDVTVWPNVPNKTVNNITYTRNCVRDRLAYVDGVIDAMVAPAEPVPCEGITLDKSTLTIDGANSVQLIATVEPENTTDSVRWATSNADVATVVNGLVTAVKNGVAAISVNCGNYSASCTVTVTGIEEVIPCTGITLSADEIVFTDEDPKTITATITPDDCTQPVTWASDADSVATVNGGVITPVANGVARITATCGDKSASVTVTVRAFVSNYPLEIVEIYRGYKLANDGTLDGDGTNAYYCVSDKFQLPKGAYVYYQYGNNKVIDTNGTSFLKICVWDNDGNRLATVPGTKWFWVGDDYDQYQFSFQLEGQNISRFTQEEIAQLLVRVDNSLTAIPEATFELKNGTWTEGGQIAVWDRLDRTIPALTDPATQIASTNILTFNNFATGSVTPVNAISKLHCVRLGRYQGDLIYYIGAGNKPSEAVDYFTENDTKFIINGG